MDPSKGPSSTTEDEADSSRPLLASEREVADTSLRRRVRNDGNESPEGSSDVLVDVNDQDGDSSDKSRRSSRRKSRLKSLTALLRRDSKTERIIEKVKQAQPSHARELDEAKLSTKYWWADMTFWIHHELESRFQNFWGESMREIEGRFGSAYVSYYHFLRWLFALNMFLSVLWMSFTLVPRIIIGANTSIRVFPASWNGDWFVGNWMFYSDVYPPVLGDNQWDLRMAWICTVFTMQLVSFIVNVKTIVNRLTGEANQSSQSLLRQPFCSAVWGTWDHSLKEKHAVQNLQGLMQNAFKEMCYNERSKDRVQPILTLKQKLWLFFKRFASFCATSGFIIGMLYLFQGVIIPYEKELDDVNKYTVPVLVTLMNQIVPFVIAKCSKFEGWPADKKNMEMQFYIGRIFLTKMLNIFLINNSVKNSSSACCEKLGLDLGCSNCCVEILSGSFFIRLLTTDMVMNVIKSYLIGYTMMTIKKSRIEFNLPVNLIELVYEETLIWIGVLYCPFLPVVACLSQRLRFLVKKDTMFRTCKPNVKVWQGLKSSTTFYWALLMAQIVSIAISATFLTSKPNCGPFKNKPSDAQYTVFEHFANHHITQVFFMVILNPAIAFSFTLFSLIVMYFLNSERSRLARKVEQLEAELDDELAEKTTLIRSMGVTL